jgi:ABC-type transport system involved in cytochrome c biogenesis permease subunit
LDDLVSKTMAIGFVFITLAVIAGTTWAFIELQSNWIREPRIAISFVTWGVYLALVCLRVTAGWRGRKAAVLTIILVGFSALTWAAHTRLGALVAKQ